MSAAPAHRPVIPHTVWALGLVSLFMDISSEIAHGLLPVFLTVSLGASVAVVGMIEGVAEATATIVKVFSGYVSDRIGKRKPLLVLGYGLAAASKPLFPLADTTALVLGARFADRIGKGLRGAPRDALVADATPRSILGRAYGLRQSLDAIGAFVGPLLAIALMVTFANDIRSVLWVAVIPALLSVACVILAVRESAPVIDKPARAPIGMSDLRRLGSGFWGVAGIGIVFTLARFSEAFLILKANAEGLPLALAPLALVVMAVVYAVGAYPAGALADAVRPRALLLLGLAVLIAADLMLAMVPGLIGAFAGISLWGAHMALTQGLLVKMVADNAPAELRGSAFGLFNLLAGLALLLASVLAGLVWEAAGPAAPFLVGAAIAATALILLVAVPEPQRQ